MRCDKWHTWRGRAARLFRIRFHFQGVFLKQTYRGICWFPIIAILVYAVVLWAFLGVQIGFPRRLSQEIYNLQANLSFMGTPKNVFVGSPSPNKDVVFFSYNFSQVRLRDSHLSRSGRSMRANDGRPNILAHGFDNRPSVVVGVGEPFGQWAKSGAVAIEVMQHIKCGRVTAVLYDGDDRPHCIPVLSQTVIEHNRLRWIENISSLGYSRSSTVNLIGFGNFRGLLLDLPEGFVHRIPLPLGVARVVDNRDKGEGLNDCLWVKPFLVLAASFLLVYVGLWQMKFGSRPLLGLGALLLGLLVAIYSVNLIFDADTHTAQFSQQGINCLLDRV